MKRILLIAVLAALVVAVLPSVALASGPTPGSLWKVKYYQKVYRAPSDDADASCALWGDTVEVVGLGPNGWVKVRWSYRLVRGGMVYERAVIGWVRESSFGTSLVPSPLGIRLA